MSRNNRRVRFREEVEVVEHLEQAENSAPEEANQQSDDDIDWEAQLEVVKPKRGAVQLDGYRSDEASSDEELYNKKKLKINDKDGDLNDEIDMFGEDDKVQKESQSKLNQENNEFKKKPKFISIDTIEGQEEESKFTNDDGIKIEAFNLKDLENEGQFDENGNFVWNKVDPQQIHDSWLNGITEEDIEKAKQAKEARLEKFDANVGSELELLSLDELKMKLINLMHPKESVTQALNRWGAPLSKSKIRKNHKRNSRKDVKSSPEVPSLTEEEQKQYKLKFEALTDLADHLFNRGVHDVYQLTYEQIVRMLRVNDHIPENWNPGELLEINVNIP